LAHRVAGIECLGVTVQVATAEAIIGETATLVDATAAVRDADNGGLPTDKDERFVAD
jgi:hypothetical protein